MVVMLHIKLKQKNIMEQVGQGVEILQMQDILVAGGGTQTAALVMGGGLPPAAPVAGVYKFNRRI